MTSRTETVIVGGGVAGLACARRLHDSGRTFRLITEEIGGRVRSSAGGNVSLGAYYVRDDYDHVGRYVDRGRRMKRRHTLCGAPDGSFTRPAVPLLAHLPQALRFLRLLREFRQHYNDFKRECELVSQAEALSADPFLEALYHEPAPSYIRRHRLEDVRHYLLGPAIQSTGFTSVDALSAFTLLVGVLPVIVPIYEHTFRFDRLTRGFEDAVTIDSVTALSATSTGHAIVTRGGGMLDADNVVVATPVEVSARLLDLGPVKSPMAGHMFLLHGTLRKPWANARYAMFPERHPLLAIARQADGSVLLCSSEADPDFGLVLHTWEIVEHHHWDPAFHLGGDVLLPCELRPGLYLIGDHNVCDLEDVYITGVYAANRITASR